MIELDERTERAKARAAEAEAARGGVVADMSVRLGLTARKQASTVCGG